MSNRKVVIVNNNKKSEANNGTLNDLFKDYQDDGIREPPIDFGQPVGNEVFK